MTQEDKRLLIQDLCARLPYGVKVRGLFLDYSTDKDKILYEEYDKEMNLQDLRRYESLKPYLRSMDDMTEDEKKEYYSILYNAVSIPGREYDFYNSHHFDYRGLIERGLAIKVTEENNPYKN